MLSKDNVINLEDFRAKDKNRISKVFTGRDKGEYVRKMSKIDQLEGVYEKVKIIIPDNVYSINPSFLEEFLINVVSKLGKEKFLEKFEFVSEGDYEYAKPLNQAIDRILKNNTALDR
jgi:2-phospho-L-lactate guanylyltransferase (CobY/MobA/RfbA family)